MLGDSSEASWEILFYIKKKKKFHHGKLISKTIGELWLDRQNFTFWMQNRQKV